MLHSTQTNFSLSIKIPLTQFEKGLCLRNRTHWSQEDIGGCAEGLDRSDVHDDLHHGAEGRDQLLQDPPVVQQVHTGTEEEDRH